MKNDNVSWKGKRILAIVICVMMIAMDISPVFASESKESLSNDEAYFPELIMETGYIKPVALEVDTSIPAYKYVGDISTYSLSSESTDTYDWRAYSSDYYYNQLSSAEQEAWDELDAICYEYLTTNVDCDNATPYIDASDSLTDDQAYKILQAFAYSNPQYYFLNSGSFYPYASHMSMLIYDQYSDGDVRAAYTEVFKSQIEEWTDDIEASGTTDIEKELAAYDLICNQISYVSTTLSQSAASAVFEKKTVCAGYTKLFSLLMNGMGIETVGMTSDTHAWNEININNNWYVVDATWGDQESYILYSPFNATYERISSTFDNDIHHVIDSTYSDMAPEVTANYDTSVRASRYALPLISISEGTVDMSFQSNITGALIYYTTDGSTPTTSSTLYTEPFTIADGTVLTVITRGSYFGPSRTMTRIIDSDNDDSIGDITNISNATVAAIPASTYTGSAIKPALNITYNGITLTEGTDYSVEYTSNVNAGIATATITGMGNYAGSRTINYTINKAQQKLTGTSSYTVDQKTGSFSLNIANSGKGTLTYTSSNTGVASVSTAGLVTVNGAGTATIKVQAQATTNYLASNELTITITVTNDINDVTVTAIPDQAYTGSVIKPALTVRYNGVLLTNNTDYTVAYSSNIEPGVATAVITGKGNYKSTKTVNFNIVKASQTITGTTDYEVVVGDSDWTLDAVSNRDGELTYSSSNTAVVTVDSQGNVSIKGKGSAVITVSSAQTEHYKAAVLKVNVVVTDEVEQTMTLNMNKTTLDESFSVAISSNGSGTVTYTSSNPTVASVSNSGMVDIKKAGSTNITATVKENGKYQGATLVIVLKVTNANPVIDISKYTVSGIADKTYTGSNITQSLSVKGSTTLVAGTDYTVSYYNNKNIGSAVVVITGMGNYKGSIVKTFTIRPAATTLSQAAATGYNSVKLTWTAVTGASGYTVYRSTSSGGTYTALTNATGTTYTNTGLTSGTTYYYKVRAYRTLSDGTKVYSTSYSSVKSAKPIPGTSTISSATSTGYNSAKLTWSAVSGASGYAIYRSTSSNGTYSYITSVTGTSYTNTGLTSGVTYYYKIRAYRTVSGKKIYGNYSAAKSVKPVPAKVTVKSTSSTVKNKNVIKWNKVSGASGYEIYRSTSSKGTYSKIATITSGSTVTYTNTGCKSGTTYYYKIRAYRTVNGKKIYGSYSSIASRKCK